MSFPGPQILILPNPCV